MPRERTFTTSGQDRSPGSGASCDRPGRRNITSDSPLWRRWVGEIGCGLCVDPSSSQAIAGAIRSLVDSPVDVEGMGRAGREAVIGRYNWPTEEKKLIEFYVSL